MKYTINEVITLCVLNEVEIKHPIFSYKEMDVEDTAKIVEVGLGQLKESQRYDVEKGFTDEVMKAAFLLKKYAEYNSQLIYAGLLYGFDKEKGEGVLIEFEDLANISWKAIVGEIFFLEISKDKYTVGFEASEDDFNVWHDAHPDLLEGVTFNKEARNLEYIENGIVKFKRTFMNDEDILLEMDTVTNRVKKTSSKLFRANLLDVIGGEANEWSE